jgi:hypothetical protein
MTLEEFAQPSAIIEPAFRGWEHRDFQSVTGIVEVADKGRGTA